MGLNYKNDLLGWNLFWFPNLIDYLVAFFSAAFLTFSILVLVAEPAFTAKAHEPKLGTRALVWASYMQKSPHARCTSTQLECFQRIW
jgi:hypothetical protein